MINFPAKVFESPLWIIGGSKDSAWYNYFDWLSQFELSKYNHLKKCSEAGYSLFIGPARIGNHQLLLVDWQQLSLENFSKLWKSLGAPQATVFKSDLNTEVLSYIRQNDKFVLLSEEI